MQKKAIAIIAVGLVVAISMATVLTGLSDSYGEEESSETKYDKRMKFDISNSTKPVDAGTFWQNDSYTLVLYDICKIPIGMKLAQMSDVKLIMTTNEDDGSTKEETIDIATSGGSIQCSTIEGVNVKYSFSEKPLSTNQKKNAVEATFVLNKSENASFKSITLQLSFIFNNTTGAKLSQPIVITVADAHDIKVTSNCTVQVFKADSIDQEKTRADYGSTIQQAISDSIVMIVPWPSDEGKIDSVTVTDSDGQSLDTVKKSEYRPSGSTSSQFVWFFTMPDRDVDIKVKSTAHKLILNCNEEAGSVELGNYGNPISIDGVAVGSEGGYTAASLEVNRDKTHYFKDDIVVLKPIPKEEDGYSFKEWRIVSGDASISGNNLRMGSQDTVVEAIFEKDSGISCDSEISGANVVLKVSIDLGDEISDMADARILVVAKYGVNIINVYSKPVLADGKGSDTIVLSKLGLTQVVLQVVDGFQPASDGSVSSVCHYIYEPDATR